jgi:site-specific recombinase XerD
MGIRRRGGRWHFFKRVPKRYAHLDRRDLVRVALHTDSETEARRKAVAVEAELIAYWEALAGGRDDDAARRYEAARALAAARGFEYRPSAEIVAGPLDDLLARLESLVRGGRLAPPEEAAAILGKVERPRLTLSDALDEFFDLTTDRLAGKSEGQVRRWRTPRVRAVRDFVEVVGADKALDEITREDALTFRRWWRDRIEGKGMDANSGNKDFQHLSDLFRTVTEMKGLGLDNPFGGLRFKQQGNRETFPFSVGWIRDTLLAPGALDGMGQEARDVLLVMVNTGARPSEIVGARAEDFALAEPVPHLRIRAHDGRSLKTDHSRRDLPLAGVSLDAARRLAKAGGPRHYAGKNDLWSATVNKFLRLKGLRETPDHTAYSLRHSFESRLIAARVDERLRAELMGHKYGRPKYGSVALEMLAGEVGRVAL